MVCVSCYCWSSYYLLSVCVSGEAGEEAAPTVSYEYVCTLGMCLSTVISIEGCMVAWAMGSDAAIATAANLLKHP